MKSEAGEFPKMEVMRFNILKSEPGKFPKKDLLKSQTSTLTSLKSTVSSLESKYSLRMKRDLMSLLCSYSLDARMISNDFKSKPYDERLLPLKLEGLLPKEIIRDAENGDRSWSWSSNSFRDAYLDFIPKAILNLAADLSVHQLVQTLISICKGENPQTTKFIKLSTRSDFEKRTVMATLNAALNDKHHALDIRNSFCGPLTIDASGYPTSEAEKELKHDVCQLLQLSTIEDDGILCTRQIEDEMSRSRYLVILVDRDGEEIVDPQKLGFCGSLIIRETSSPCSTTTTSASVTTTSACLTNLCSTSTTNILYSISILPKQIVLEIYV